MTAKPYAYYRAVLSGNTLDGQTWSTGTSVVGAAAAPVATDMNAWAAAVKAKAVTLWDAINGMIGPDTSFNMVKTYYYPPGEAEASEVGMSGLSPALFGVTGSNQHPLQVSLVCSLTTGLAGAHNRGRMYLPINSMALTSRLMNTADTTTVGTALGAYITALNTLTIAGEASHVVIAGSALSPAVTGVTTDNKPDIQRRRTDKVSASFEWLQPV